MLFQALTLPSTSKLLEPLIPELVLVGGILLVLLIDLTAGRRPFHNTALVLSGLTLLGYMGMSLFVIEADSFRLPDPTLLFAPSGVQFYWRFLIAMAIGGGLLLHAGERQAACQRSEIPLFWLGLGLGLALLSMARHMVSLFVSFELVSLCSYVLVASHRSSPRAAEAALKYVLYGAFASALLLVGLALVFVLTGRLYFDEISQALQKLPAESVLFAWVWVYAGLAFKVGALPFQFWVPDVYQGAPSSVSAGLSVAPKAVGLLLLIHLRSVLLPTDELSWSGSRMLGVLACALIFVATVQAWKQVDFRRLLAYSSLSHTGYLMLAVALNTPEGHYAIQYYIVVYAVMQYGAFALAEVIEQSTGSAQMASASGLGRGSPLQAISATLILLSLAGLPPFWGFWAKFLLFKSLWMTYSSTGDQFWLYVLVFAVLSTALGLFYYLKLPFYVWLRQGEVVIRTSWIVRSITVASAAVLAFALFFFI
jgi:NADH-quinone oxidoreductase subunit N